MPPLREVIARHGIVARKSLGQNFLLDLNLTGRIARAAGPLEHATVVEIGPGPGALTRALLAAGARRILAIERDPRCLAALGEIAAAYPGRLELVAGDALRLDPVELSDAPRKIVANLPYNIATPLLIGWLDRIGEYESLTLMFQREVAERLTAMPRSKSYGRLSVLVQWLAEPQILFDIPPRAFVPPPKVTSSVVRIVPRPEPLAPAEKPARSNASPPPRSASAARCCGPASRRSASRSSRSSTAPGSRRRRAPRNSRSPSSARLRGSLGTDSRARFVVIERAIDLSLQFHEPRIASPRAYLK